MQKCGYRPSHKLCHQPTVSSQIGHFANLGPQSSLLWERGGAISLASFQLCFHSNLSESLRVPLSPGLSQSCPMGSQEGSPHSPGSTTILCCDYRCFCIFKYSPSAVLLRCLLINGGENWLGQGIVNLESGACELERLVSMKRTWGKEGRMNSLKIKRIPLLNN